MVKLDSLKQKGDGNILSLLRQTGEVWRTDGVLGSAVAMGLDDLEDCIAFFRNLGLQSENAPVDFYIFATDIGEPCYLTHNDGMLEFFRDENHRSRVCLKDPAYKKEALN